MHRTGNNGTNQQARLRTRPFFKHETFASAAQAETAASNEKTDRSSRSFSYLVFGCVLTSVIAVLVYLFAGASVHARRIADEMIPRAESMSRLATRLQSGQISYDSFMDFTLKEQQGTRVYIFDENAKLIAYTSENGIIDQHISQSILDYGTKVVTTGQQVVSPSGAPQTASWSGFRLRTTCSASPVPS